MFFSIITVSLNAEDLIEGTIRSVLSQTFDDFEIIVKDGCSTDGTLARIPSDERIRVITRKDKGIYEAMNQGIAEASGKYLLFLNCGDTLYDRDVLSRVYDKLKHEEQPGILYGRPCIQDDHIVVYPDKLKKRFFYFSTICHQAAFIARALFDQIGFYDENMKISSDWKFFLDAKIAGVAYIPCDVVVCTYLGGGVSESEKGKAIMEAERNEVVSTRFSAFERFYIPLLQTKPAQALIALKNKLKRH